MDKVPDFGSGDCRFESCRGRCEFIFFPKDTNICGWPSGLMDKASVSDTGDCRFKSCQGSFFFLAGQTAHILADIVLKLTHIQKAIGSPSEASSPPKDRVA